MSDETEIDRLMGAPYALTKRERKRLKELLKKTKERKHEPHQTP